MVLNLWRVVYNEFDNFRVVLYMCKAMFLGKKNYDGHLNLIKFYQKKYKKKFGLITNP